MVPASNFPSRLQQPVLPVLTDRLVSSYPVTVPDSHWFGFENARAYYFCVWSGGEASSFVVVKPLRVREGVETVQIQSGCSPTVTRVCQPVI